MAGNGRARGEYAKTAARRVEILQAGVDVFSASGYRSGSIREIADRVGMSQAGLLHHFANKSELLQAVLTHRDDIARERMGLRAVLGTGEDAVFPRGVSMLRALADLVAHNAQTPGLVALFTVLSAEATSPEHPAHAYFAGRYDFVIGIVRTAFEEMAADRQLREGVEPESAARALVAIMDGLQMQWLLEPAAVDMALEVRRHVQSQITVPL